MFVLIVPFSNGLRVNIVVFGYNIYKYRTMLLFNFEFSLFFLLMINGVDRILVAHFEF